jgi:hypothetical protein
MQENPPERRRARLYKRIELVLESLLWRFRLIAIVPVVMSLASTLLTFAVGTRDIIKSIKFFLHAPESEKSANIALASVVSGIDFYLIGVALLIFGYGLYELLISSCLLHLCVSAFPQRFVYCAQDQAPSLARIYTLKALPLIGPHDAKF